MILGLKVKLLSNKSIGFHYCFEYFNDYHPFQCLISVYSNATDRLILDLYFSYPTKIKSIQISHFNIFGKQWSVIVDKDTLTFV